MKTVILPDGRELFRCTRCHGQFFGFLHNKDILTNQHVCANQPGQITFNNGANWASEPGGIQRQLPDTSDLRTAAR